MKVLIVEDDFHCRLLLSEHFAKYDGFCHMAANGKEAVEAVRISLEDNERYDLVCLDIMMPEMDGHEALTGIRNIESRHEVSGLDCAKVLMVTACGDFQNIVKSFQGQCEGYLVKPITWGKLKGALAQLGFEIPCKLGRTQGVASGDGMLSESTVR